MGQKTSRLEKALASHPQQAFEAENYFGFENVSLFVAEMTETCTQTLMHTHTHFALHSLTLTLAHNTGTVREHVLLQLCGASAVLLPSVQGRGARVQVQGRGGQPARELGRPLPLDRDTQETSDPTEYMYTAHKARSTCTPSLCPRVVDGGVTATGVLSRQRGNLITIVITHY